MQVHFLRNNSAPNLVVVALGWGSDYSVVAHLCEQIPDNQDIVCIYDYKSISNIDHITRAYTKVYLLAWSFGVWASERIFSDDIVFERALALCGSPLPLSDEFGLGEKRLKATIKGFKRVGVENFNSEVYKDKITLNTKRQQEEMIEELEILQHLVGEPFTTHIKWDAAIIGEQDSIFPTKNLLTYWSSLSIILPLPHYPFKDYSLFAQQLGI